MSTKTPAKTTKKSKKRAPLSAGLILRAALKMADEEGIESLSMRRLAAALKVEAMSLYNHLPGKENILDGLVELVVDEIEMPAAGADWRDIMRRRALSAHTVLMRHPWATQLFASRVHVGPSMLHYVDRTIGCLIDAGFSYPLADHAWNALDSYIYGFTFHKLNFPLDPSEYASAAAQFIHLIPPEQFPHLHGMSQEVIAGRHDGLHRIELGLELLLDGLERLRRADLDRAR